MTQAFLHRLLHGLVGMAVGPEKALAVVDGLLAGCETKTAVVNRELHELAQLARQVAGLVRHASGTRRQALLGRRTRPSTRPNSRRRFARFLEDHGHREMDMDYYHPTWSGQPWIVLDSLALILRSGGGEDPAETARRQRQRYSETEHQFLGGVPEPLRFFFRELIRLARTLHDARRPGALPDDAHQSGGAARGGRPGAATYRSSGILDAAEDVFFSHKADLEELIASPAAKRDELSPQGLRSEAVV